MAINRYHVRQLVPTAEIPSIEALESKPLHMSDIFPESFVDGMDGSVLGDYRGGDPNPDSPLFETAETIRVARAQAFKQGGEGDKPLADEAHRVLAATLIQKKLVSSISQAHSNLIGDGYSPATTGIVIAHHVEERDKERHEFYEGQISRVLSLMDGVRAAKTLTVPARVLKSAFSDERCSADDAYHVSPELQKEALLQDLNRQKELNELRLERLRFEWLSSSVIVDALNEATVSHQPLALAS